MKIQKLCTLGMTVLMTAVLVMSATLAGAEKNRQMTPELAAKKENIRKQREQRVTDDKRQTASSALKDERRKIYDAKQLAKKSQQDKNDHNKNDNK